MEEETRTFRVAITETGSGTTISWTSLLTQKQTIGVEVDDNGNLMVTDPGSNRITMVAAGFWREVDITMEEED